MILFQAVHMKKNFIPNFHEKICHIDKITSISVVGPGLGNIIGPEESFSSLPSSLKIVLSASMIMGRLEFIAFFVLLLPSFWKQK